MNCRNRRWITIPRRDIASQVDAAVAAGNVAWWNVEPEECGSAQTGMELLTSPAKQFASMIRRAPDFHVRAGHRNAPRSKATQAAGQNLGPKAATHIPAANRTVFMCAGASSRSWRRRWNAATPAVLSRNWFNRCGGRGALLIGDYPHIFSAAGHRPWRLSFRPATGANAPNQKDGEKSICVTLPCLPRPIRRGVSVRRATNDITAE